MFTMEIMKGYGETGTDIIGESQEKVKSAQEMRTEIEILKEGLQNMPSGLDDDIVASVQAAEQAGREQATNDIAEVQNQIDQDMAKAEAIKGNIDSQIDINNTAGESLKNLKSNRFGGGIDRAIDEIKSNNAVGETIKSNIDAAYQAIRSQMDDTQNGI